MHPKFNVITVGDLWPGDHIIVRSRGYVGSLLSTVGAKYRVRDIRQEGHVIAVTKPGDNEEIIVVAPEGFDTSIEHLDA